MLDRWNTTIFVPADRLRFFGGHKIGCHFCRWYNEVMIDVKKVKELKARGLGYSQIGRLVGVSRLGC